MVNPVELISRSRRRIARLAATKVVITGLPVVAITIGLGAGVKLVAGQVWHQWGYLIDPSHLATLRIGVFVAAGLAAIVTAYLAWRAWQQANDFEQAAQMIDTLIGAHQELLTLATLADPAHPETKDRRSPLFAILWRRAIAYLERFDPNREFPLEPVAPLKRSSVLAGAAAAILGLAMLALMRVPSPLEALAYNLRDAAENISGANTTGDEQLAAAERDVANDLDNPRLPPQQKLAELESIRQEIEKPQQQTPSAQSGTGNSTANGSGSGEGSGNGTGEGTGGANEKGAGAGPGAGSGNGGKGNNNDQQQMTLKNDIAKAQAKLESEVNSDNQSKTTPSQGQKGSGFMPQAGNNPHQAGPQAGPNGAGNVPLTEPGKLAQSTAPPSSSNPSARKDDKGTQGDTHLGDFPKAVAYERFYKLGEKGPPPDLKNARYVTFRVPPAIVTSGGEGRVVHDTSVPAATAPYTNAPLKDDSLVVAPDEEQLLPPRYRDLIH